ncbi:hypothetical protein NMG60_11006837 [Bertholletia excelsa]
MDRPLEVPRTVEIREERGLASRSKVIKLPPWWNLCSAVRTEAGLTYQLSERKPFKIETTARKEAIMLSNQLVISSSHLGFIYLLIFKKPFLE